MIISELDGTLANCENSKTSIKKEYFINEFKKIFEKWDYKLANGMDMYDEEEFFNDLINIIQDKK